VAAGPLRGGKMGLQLTDDEARQPDGSAAGPAADQVGPELGPAITEDFPEALDALLARATS
jgi:hypothetical protein